MYLNLLTPPPPAQVIAEHLYQQGHFRVGDTFVREAGVADGDALKAPLHRHAHPCSRRCAPHARKNFTVPFAPLCPSSTPPPCALPCRPVVQQ